ncbi:hypothetical protein [Sulfurospirillum cavolei]|uniref:hypothetical protein n=1 Tax=Sulfurospirillum cavolei TaxID=366522 RepID=UPI0005AA4961|nr:hypothetical protein [Sulfurospirillum cavolei]
MEDKIEHKIPPFLPISIAFIGDRRLKRLNKDLPNCQGIGIVFSIFLELIKEKNLSYPLDEIDILADEINTSVELTATVIKNYNLFDFFEDNSGKKFFSTDLKILLEPYYRKVEVNRQNAKLGAKKKELKIKNQLLELDKKLSTNDSNQRPQSDGSANVMDYNLNNIKKESNPEYEQDENENYVNIDGKKIPRYITRLGSGVANDFGVS